MKLLNIIRFFLVQSETKDWIFIFFNFLLTLLITFCEIFFLSCIYLLLTNQLNSNLINIFLDNFNFINNTFLLNINLTNFLIFFIIFLLIFKNILLFFQNYFYSKFIHNLLLNKSSKILSVYFNLDFQSFIKKDLSIYAKQVLRDIDTVFLGVFSLLISFVGELVYISILLFYLNYLINFFITLEIIILFLILIYCIYFTFKLSDKLGNMRALNEVKVFKTLNNILNIFRELKLSNKSKIFIEKYKVYLGNYYNSRIYSGLINISPKFIFEIFAIMLFFFLYKESNLEVEKFFLKFSILALALIRLIPSFSKLAFYVTSIYYNFHSISFIKNDLNKNVKLNLKKIKFEPINTIRLSNISFFYDTKFNNYNSNNKFKTSNMFKNFNLTLKKNKIYGIYGLSGSGKTSLLNIIIGFIKPHKGKIFFNNNIQIFNNISKKFNISFLPQNPTILDENISINTTLQFSNKLEEIQKIKFYLKKFNLNKFLDYKYINNDSNLSIRNISGGEKQRIAFIRSIINEPDLLILDEPTASLDQDNSNIILNFLKYYKKNRIIIITSHKENEKKFMDKIINL